MKEKEKILDKGEQSPVYNKLIAFDFDGVIHSYTSGWHGPTVIKDPPVEGAIPLIRSLISIPNYNVCIFSTRNFLEGGIEAMKDYLVEHGLDRHQVDEYIRFPLEKEPFHLFIDDRAFAFKGEFPRIQEILDFEPWNVKKKVMFNVK